MRSPEWAGEECHAHLAAVAVVVGVALSPLEQEAGELLVVEGAVVVDTTAAESGRAYLA